ncbi:DUF1254 domain-containing protein [uncultured Rhodoblastus sp.]|uniref:DUF1254 domain-containing protein n=1 Tax=uncultured Rhodoblastus sp. TaxID=543037 RepID=UPI0025E760B6|nr:DUF1254 domain-containing protein [uncultured Rhodoblastus sp.]
MITRRNLLSQTALSAALVSISGLAARAEETAGRPGFFAAKNIAEAGYVYGLPIVMNYAVLYEFFIDKTSSQYKGPFNEIHSAANVFTYKDTAVVTPNSDTPYSMLGMDLRAEPIVISVPAIEKERYYSVQLVDGNTYNFGYIGTRATGPEAGDYLVVGPDWQGDKPQGIGKIFRSTTQFAVAIFRTQLFNPADIDNVRKIQALYRAQPLSAFLHQPAPPAAPALDFPKIDKELAKQNFFDYLDFALQFAPAAENEKEIRAQLAQIGVGPGKTFRFKELSLEKKLETVIGLKQGKDKVDAAVETAGTKINGWNISAPFGDAAHFNGDWLLRAAAAQAGIYGNNAEEAMYPMTRNAVSGEIIDAGAHAYTLTFPAGDLPPVNAFWSVTMYDSKTQLLIKNPIDRYLINSPMLPGMKKNPDGSVTIYIQHASPGPDKESNWLPAPDGPVYLVMRLYWPKKNPPSILPAGKGDWKPPGVVKV